MREKKRTTKMRIRNSLFLLVLVSTLLVSGCQNSNGKIVEKELVDDLSYADYVECYEIVYLSDGLRVPGFIIKPKSEGVYPVIIFNRGGQKEYGKIDENLLEGLVFVAAEGYVVVASQYRGLPDFEGADEFGGADVHDVLNLFPLINQLPYADTDNVFMVGMSRGGMMTYLAIKEGAPIKAAAVIGAPSDLIQLYHQREYRMKTVLEDSIGGTPQEKEEEYKERSAYYWPEKITVPVLILHGTNDSQCDVSHAYKLAEELENLGMEYELVIYPGDDHGLSKHGEDAVQKIFAWINKYMQSSGCT